MKNGGRLAAITAASSLLLGGSFAAIYALHQEPVKSHSVIITADCSKKIPNDDARVPGALTINSIAKDGFKALTPMIAQHQATYRLVFDHSKTPLGKFGPLAQQFFLHTCNSQHMPKPEWKKPTSTRGDKTRNNKVTESRQGSIIFKIDTRESVAANVHRLSEELLSTEHSQPPGIYQTFPKEFTIVLDKSATPESSIRGGPSYKGLIKDAATLFKTEDQERFKQNFLKLQNEIPDPDIVR